MVLLAASVCTKDGKALLSRQFVEMTKARIEGLIATFPKLLGEGKQHTFVETDSVRYVYQPLEKLYVLLITTKASNILEDLETLRLFARVIPEYACGTSETDILNNAFQLIFAFDEIVALGYREDVNLSQIRILTEMDSHEERVFRAVQESKEREAKEVMKQRARDLQLARQEAAKRGGASGIGLGSARFTGHTYTTGFSSENTKPDEPRVVAANDRFGLESTESATPTRVPGAKWGGGMKLGGPAATEKFVSRLKAEGEVVSDNTAEVSGETTVSRTESANIVGRGAVDAKPVTKEDLHLHIEEKITVEARRDGALNHMEIQGILNAFVSTPTSAEARLQIDATESLNPANERQPATQLQPHPNLDKKVFLSTGWLQVKSGNKPFPVGREVGLLRWRLQTTEESVLPITVNCWPNEIRGGFEVNIEFELQNTNLELHDVVMTIPLPPGPKPPVLGSYDGDYEVNSRRTQLSWHLPLIDSNNPSGSIEFTMTTEKGTSADQFFPIKLTMHSDRSLCGIRVVGATDSQKKPLAFSTETKFQTEKYEIV